MTSKTIPCECWEAIGTQLEPHNAQLSLSRAMTMQGEFFTVMAIPTHKINTKWNRKTPSLFASFCPFCGKDLRVKAEEVAA